MSQHDPNQLPPHLRDDHVITNSPLNPKQPRYLVRPSAEPYGYYWEAYDSYTYKPASMPTADRAKAQSKADDLNRKDAGQKTHKLRTVLIVVMAILAGLLIIGVLIGGVSNSSAPVQQRESASPMPSSEPTEDTADPTPAPHATKAKPKMTAGQEQATGSALSYLEMSAFSRKGLIRQLSSSAADGYSVTDATYAVDHIVVNWNAQAARAARNYLSLTHFSRSGLIRQLESSAGDGFTHSQAVYGVKKAGL